ncbi:MAG: site-specific integrase [Deltaproteobacteria bacterium]|nr:site-specific integrase [Deltaproteobacteria bacterium]
MTRARRGRGEGGVYQRPDGLWSAQLSLGYDGNGGRLRRTLYGQSKRDVQAKLRALQTDADVGTLVAPERLTVSQFLSRWLDSAKQTIRATTAARYRALIRVSVGPHIGGIPVQKLQPLQVQALYAKLEAAGLAPSTRRQVHAILHRAFAQAVRWGNMVRNPCDAVDKPRVPKHRVDALKPEEVAKLAEAASGDRLAALYVLALSTGMRQGELLGLQWSDVDLPGRAVVVRHSLEEIAGKLRLSETKSGKVRRVDLDAHTVDALREHRKRMLAEGHPGPWVFPDTEGNPLRKSNLVRRSFKPLLKRAGLPDIRFHDLRHAAATLMLLQGVNPKVVQERLGHAQLTITLDVYGHVLPTMQADAVAKMDAFWRSAAVTTA